jgi:hypothetical protein
MGNRLTGSTIRVSRRAFEERVEFGREAQRPVVAVAWPSMEVDVVVADQVDVLVVGVVNAGDLPVGQLDPEPSEAREAERDAAGVPVVDRVGAEPAGSELAVELLGVRRLRDPPRRRAADRAERQVAGQPTLPIRCQHVSQFGEDHLVFVAGDGAEVGEPGRAAAV